MATLPNQSGGNSNIRKILTTDAVHADVVNLTHVDTDENIDAVNTESAANASEIAAARGSEANLDDRITPLEATTTEVVTARGSEADLNARLGAMGSLTPQEQLDVLAELNKAQVPSGVLVDIPQIQSTSLGAIYTNDNYSNFFTIKSLHNIIADGYKLSLTRSYNNGADCKITLNAPPTTGTRVDTVFLEVFKNDITNPASSSQADRRVAGLLDDGTLAPYGNMDYYGSSLRNGGLTYDPADPNQRFQVQYRLRVVDGIDRANYPEGIGDTAKVKAWPTNKRDAGDGVSETTYTFSKSSTDAGLYVAGDGSSAAKTALGTADGYVYAIPICNVFRRNSTAYAQLTNPDGAGVAMGGTSDRPDGLFYDQIDKRDVEDLRHQISFSGFNYQELLEKNLDLLLRGELRTNLVKGDGVGESSSVYGTYKMYCEQVGGSDANNVNNRTVGNNTAITAMAPNGQRRNWNDAANTESCHAKVSQTTTDLLALNVDYGAKRSTGTGNWAQNDVITLSSPTWASLDTAQVYIYDESGNDVTSEFNITGTGNNADCTITAASPTFATETNLHVVYEIDYPAGGGFVNVPSNMLKIEDGAGLLWGGDTTIQIEADYYDPDLYFGQVVWSSPRVGLILESKIGSSALAVNTNQVILTMPSGFTACGIHQVYSYVSAGPVTPTSWSQSNQDVTINTASGIASGDSIVVQVYVTTPFARFQEETKAILGTYQTKEISVTVDGSGNGTAYLDYGDIGLFVTEGMQSLANIRDASNNIETGTVTVSAHKVVISGCSQVSATVKTTIVVGKTVLNNDHLRVWYEYVPYMGTGTVLHGKTMNSLEVLGLSNQGFLTTIGTGGLDTVGANNLISDQIPLNAYLHNYTSGSLDSSLLNSNQRTIQIPFSFVDNSSSYYYNSPDRYKGIIHNTGTLAASKGLINYYTAGQAWGMRRQLNLAGLSPDAAWIFVITLICKSFPSKLIVNTSTGTSSSTQVTGNDANDDFYLLGRPLQK